MGVLVFIMAIISLAGGNTIHLMRAESPGPSPGKLVPKIGQTAKILYGIYMMMTGAEILLLYLGGMPIFDSIVNSFATAGTGGFTLINDSIAFYDSAYLQGVINVFMVLFGVSFNFYFLIMIKKVTQALHYEEVWAYLVIIGSAIILVACNLFGPIYQTLGEALRYASFHVVSLMTTTGFITADYTQWPQFSQFVLFFLTFVGGCAVSTGGGIKVARILLLFKAARMEIDKLIHPRAVQSLHLNGKPVEPFIMKGIRAYMVAYAAIFIASTLIISWEGFDFVTTLTVVSGSINNIGTGLGAIGPGSSLAIFNPVSKIVSIFDMLAGRLEIFPIWVMLMPGIWKATRNNKI
jgi:trk system potassium uptake protein TrkH